MDTPKIDKVKELIKGIKFAMFQTHGTATKNHHMRPMATHEGDDVEQGLWFITSRSSPKVFEIATNEQVTLTYQKDYDFLVLEGRAEIIKDKQKLKEIWSPAYNIWFPKGKDDPEICLIKVKVDTAEYWASPSKSITYGLKLINNIMGKEHDELGEHEKINF